MEQIYKESFKRPFDSFKKLSITMLMYLIPFINTITQFFGLGYTLECAKTAMKSKYKLPEWNNLGSKWVNGLLAAIISFIYMIPAIIFFGIGGLFSVTGLFSIKKGAMMLPPFSASMFIGIILALLAYYFIPIAVISFIDKNNFGEAFNLSKISKKVFTSNYLAVWIVMLVYGIIASLIVFGLDFALSMTIIIPFFIQAYAGAIVGITSMTLFGIIYKKLG